MPYWWVSEPRINVRLEDVPLAYKPSRGPSVSFHISYRQRGSYPADDDFFGLGEGWSSNVRAFMSVLTNEANVLIIAGHRGGAGIDGYSGLNVPQLYTCCIPTALANESWEVSQPDGTREIYGVVT
jgi:hypothetical protein